MAVTKEIYAELEQIVGAENVTNDPIMMPSYFSLQDGAVVLPASTEEVQAVVRLCNRNKLCFASGSTGWMGMFPPGTIYMDLRRMNRIVEINEKNMYAVVEPYVLSSQLQAELMKRGLNCNIKGAGSNCAAIVKGHGHMDQTCGGDDRNYLAVEWVTPEGEIMRLGSLGSSDEWFCGDGPGPSLRALISGTVPPGVTPGVFTKAAQKVYPWPGPTEFPLKGVSPDYSLSEIPRNTMVRYYSFPDAEKMYKAERTLGEQEVTYELMCFNMAMVSSNISSSNEIDMETFEMLRHKVKGPGFMVIITGATDNEFAYNKKVLEQVVKECDGESLKYVEENMEVEGKLLCQCIRVSASIRETFRRGGKSWGGFAVMGQRDLTMRWLQEAGARKGALIQQGLAMDDGAAFFGCFGWGVEHGHLGKSEIFYRPTEHPDAAKAATEWRKATNQLAMDGCFNVPSGFPPDVINPRMSNYLIWAGKVNAAFDPNGAIPKPPSFA